VVRLAPTVHGEADRGSMMRLVEIAREKGASAPEEHLGFLGGLAALDNPTSSEATRKLLGWVPTRPRLIADIDAVHYFR
jgi:hypothetical protein